VNGSVTSVSGPGCTAPSGGATRCALHPSRTKIVGNFTGSTLQYYWTIDLDRPGSVLTGQFTVGAMAGQNRLDGSSTDIGPLTLTGNTVTGGGDDDVLVGNNLANMMVGNGGDDAFAAGYGADTMIGGPGDDSFGLGAGAITPDTVVVDGGEGTQDSIGFGAHNVPVRISLNDTDDGDVAGSGGARQILQIRGVENASGGKAADVIVGGPGFNHLYGLGGADQVDGGGGGHDVLRGGDDNDSIVARDLPTLFGDVACGSGANVVIDALDVVASDCENVDRSAPDPVLPGAGGAGAGAGAGSGGDPNDRSGPTVAVRGVSAKIKRATLLNGVTVTVDPDEEARFEASLIGRARRLTLASAGDVTVVEGKLGYGAGARKIKLKPFGRAKKLTLLIVATDRSGNERVLRRTVRITR
jgi:hypothetical protein